MPHPTSRTVQTLVESLRRADGHAPSRSLLAATEVFCSNPQASGPERAAYLALFQPLFARTSDEMRRSIARLLGARVDLPEAVQALIAPYQGLEPAPALQPAAAKVEAPAAKPKPPAPAPQAAAPQAAPPQRSLHLTRVTPAAPRVAAPAPAVTPPVVTPTLAVAAPLAAKPEAPAPVDAPATTGGRALADLAVRFLEASGAQRQLLLERILTTPKDGPIDLGVGPKDAATIEQKALSRQVPLMLKALSEALGLGLATTRLIAADDDGEPLVIALAAAGLHKQQIIRVVMLTHERIGRSVERVHALASLASYIDLDSATAMVAAWRRMPMAESAPAAHKPIHGPDLGDLRARAMASASEPAAPQRSVHGPDLGDVRANGTAAPAQRITIRPVGPPKR